MTDSHRCHHQTDHTPHTQHCPVRYRRVGFHTGPMPVGTGLTSSSAGLGGGGKQKKMQILALIFLSPITTTNTPVGKTNSAKHQRTGTFRNCCRRDACTTQPTRNKSVLALPRVRASTGEVAAPTACVKRDASALCIGLARLFACLGRGNFF